jgi:hypothetical protein
MLGACGDKKKSSLPVDENGKVILPEGVISYDEQVEKAKTAAFVLKGHLDGFDSGILNVVEYRPVKKIEKIEFKGGNFVISGDRLGEPKRINFEIEGELLHASAFVDNGENTAEFKVDKGSFFFGTPRLKLVKSTGCIVNEHEAIYDSAIKKLKDNYDYDSVPEEERDAYIAKHSDSLDQAKIDFIKSFPDAYFSADLALRSIHGRSINEAKEIIAMLDPKMDNCYVRKLKAKLAEMEKTYVKPEDIIKAEDVSYKVDPSYQGKDNQDIKYMGVLSNDQLCALMDNGKIKIIGTDGNEVSSFDPNCKEDPTAIAVDHSDLIYALYPIEKKTQKKVRGKLIERMEVFAHECVVLNKEGKLQSKLTLEGLTSATGARIADGRLLVADMKSNMIRIYNTKSGVEEAKLPGMRSCCSILDFAVNDKNEILVANLGAFRVQSYDITGKELLVFGQRGKTIDDFHGCCNPVSVAYLSNGAIVTVEKDPTRIKVYSKNGAKKIQGIEELVKGCTYIPMIVDSKDNLYLASQEKGIVKCIAIN